MFRVHGFVGLEIIEASRCTPCPCPQCAPIIRLARLAFVDQPNNSFGQACAIVRLNACGIDVRVAPAIGDELFRCRWITAGRSRGAGNGERQRRGPGSRKIAAAKHHHHGNRSSSIRRSHEKHLDVHADERVRRIIDMPNELLLDHRVRGDHSVFRIDYSPRHVWHILGDAANHLAFKIFDDFGSALRPPHLCTRNLLAVLQGEHVRKIGEGICFRFVVIRVIGRVFVSARARAERIDAELIHHVLMVLVGSPIHRGREAAGIGG